MGDVARNLPETRWWTWVESVAGDVQQNAIADRVGIDRSHVSKWKQGLVPTAPFVVRFAEAYGRNPLEALVAAEIITDEQANLHEVRITDYSQASDEELLEELLRRRRERG